MSHKVLLQFTMLQSLRSRLNIYDHFRIDAVAVHTDGNRFEKKVVKFAEKFKLAKTNITGMSMTMKLNC